MRFAKKLLSMAAAAALMGAMTVSSSQASLTTSYQFNGKGNWTLDAVGGNSSPVGNIDIVVPVGSTIEKAFLYSSNTYSNFTTPTVDFDGTTINTFASLGGNPNLTAYRADVTSQVAAKVGAGGGTFTFVVNSESPSSGNIDGEVLAVVYSNPAEQTRTIAFLDGFSTSAGDAFTASFSKGLPDPTSAGFEALLSLGIGFGYQPSGQQSNVDVNGRRLTSSAGGQDDGQGANGALITVGGEGDSALNPVDPLATDSGGPRTDDELYNLALGNGVSSAPFIHTGDTQIHVNTQNPSGDDNIFFAGINITAEGGRVDPGPGPAVPVPAAAWMGLSTLGGLGLVRKARKLFA